MNLAAALNDARIVAILRRSDIDEVVETLADQLVSAGVRAIEITLDQPASLPALERLVAHVPDGVLVGAGTVMHSEQLRAVAEMGGTFVVCPHLDPELVGLAHDLELGILPGVTSGTEVATAVALGASTVKLFPAGPLGPAYLRALRGPFSQVDFVPTGGIPVEQVPDWLAAGAIAVGLSSDLFEGTRIHPAVATILADQR